MAEIEHDPSVAPPGEAIHMPEPSYMPAALAVSIAFTLVGVITWLPVLIIGAIVTLVIIVRWVRQARAEMNELPLQH